MEKSTIKVLGMSCEHCVNAITKAVGALPGISGVSVDLVAGTVTVEYDPAQSQLSGIMHEIEDAGYDMAG